MTSFSLNEFEQVLRHVENTHALEYVLDAAHYGVPQARKRAIGNRRRLGKATLPVATRIRKTVRAPSGIYHSSRME